MKCKSKYRSLTKQVTPVQRHANLADWQVVVRMQKRLAVSPIKSNLYAIINEGLLIIHIRQQKKLILSLVFRYLVLSKKGR